MLLLNSENFLRLVSIRSIIEQLRSVDPPQEEGLLLLVVRLVYEESPESLDVVDAQLDLWVGDKEAKQNKVSANDCLVAMLTSITEALALKGPN